VGDGAAETRRNASLSPSERSEKALRLGTHRVDPGTRRVGTNDCGPGEGQGTSTRVSRRVVQRVRRRRARLLFAAETADIPDSSLPPTRTPSDPSVTAALPLAPLAPGTVDLRAFRALAAEVKTLSTPRWHRIRAPPLSPEEIIDLLEGDLSVLDRTDRDPPGTGGPKRSTLTREDVFHQLLDMISWNKLAVRGIPKSERPKKPDGAFFGRPKSDKKKSRPLYDGSPGNEPAPRFALPSMDLIIDTAMRQASELHELGERAGAASIDQRSWYPQIPIAEAVGRRLMIGLTHKLRRRLARHFGIPMDDLCIIHLVLAQGWSWAPIAAQTLSEVLLAGLDPAGCIYDNYLLVDSMKQPTKVSTFLARTARTKCELNTEKSQMELQPLVSFCGGELDLDRLRHRCDSAWAEKLSAALDSVSDSRDVSYRTAYKLISSSLYFLRLTGEKLCQHRPLLSAMRVIGRRVYRGASWETPWQISPGLRAALRAIGLAAAKNDWKQWVPPPPESFSEYRYFLYTDASDWGFGWVLTDAEGHIIEQFQEAWPDNIKKLVNLDQLHISAREMFALVHAAEAIKHDLKINEPILAFQDNTAVIGGVAKGYSPKPILDSLLRTLDFTGAISYVNTLENYADALSRGERHPEDALLPVRHLVKPLHSANYSSKTKEHRQVGTLWTDPELAKKKDL